MSSDANPEPLSVWSAFFAGLRASYRSVFVFVLVGTYVGLAALAQDYGFSLALADGVDRPGLGRARRR